MANKVDMAAASTCRNYDRAGGQVMDKFLMDQRSSGPGPPRHRPHCYRFARPGRHAIPGLRDFETSRLLAGTRFACTTDTIAKRNLGLLLAHSIG